ncbi:hypothetical protein G6F70_004187 [Rhizopus microsporus]|uniref:CHCH domain-containing protein n=1 Tax=Rhizopus microsporus TaxID=58291 RepID=A0A1X0S0H9_RHIZD|nr:hypothetical protein G6F71_002675 [Rhizopus microsporus]KAG1200298.1 hypothetical protein G6F70_004187 [Rhizopus microsporus]KAG1214807.1 hypothetical protein G6F69_001567 [Rhizopus microsporus]KAG1233884.1 hypothetical protein G6F67_003960 [Rhizopus microsporus]KAG1267012.1 hypothetical protein G6F68_002268 [Rhizopus microsporus]
MPRQTRRSAPAQQTRQAHTMPVRQAPPPAAPPASRPAPAAAAPAPVAQPQHSMTPAAAAPPSIAQAAPQQPGLFAQMATTAAGVAVGSAVGHTLANGVSSLFSGSGSSEPQQAQPAQPQYQPQQYQAPQANACEADAKAFTNCLEANNNDFNACQWYLENLKACQRMAANY